MHGNPLKIHGVALAAGVLAVLALLAPLGAQVAPATSTTVTLNDIVRDLGSSDFPVRDKAQKRLDALSTESLDALTKQAEATTDPEVKSRLVARVDAITFGPYLHPPGITLAVKDASLEEVRAALAKATGYPVAGRGNGTRVSLNVKDAAWSELIRQLAQQVTLSYQHMSTGVRIDEAVGASDRMSAAGPVLFVAGSAQRALQARDQVSLSYTMFADPRMQVLQQSCSLTEAVDDRGQKLTTLPSNSRLPGSHNKQEWIFRVVVPEGSKTLTLRGEAVLKVAVKYAITEIQDPVKHVGKEFPFGAQSVKLTRFSQDRETQPVNIGLSLSGRKSMGELAGTEGPVPFGPVRYMLRDADDVILLFVPEIAAIASGPPAVPVNGAKLPLRLVLMVPERWKELVVPFELQGISVASFVQNLGAR